MKSSMEKTTKETTTIPIYQVDSFAKKLFSGNPAAVCVLDRWPEDEVLQNIALENNLSETAFLLKKSPKNYDLRWFSPLCEVNLCGHATLAAAFIVFSKLAPQPQIDELTFNTLSGELLVELTDSGVLQMQFPAQKTEVIDNLELQNTLSKAIGARVCTLLKEVMGNGFYVALLDDHTDIGGLEVDLEQIKKQTPLRHLVVSAKSKTKWDFESRVFAPGFGIAEDPVTGAAHCVLAPIYAEKLKKNKLLAYQASKRGGELELELVTKKGVKKVLIRGSATLFMQGVISIP